jgi:hypothetical protein
MSKPATKFLLVARLFGQQFNDTGLPDVSKANLCLFI